MRWTPACLLLLLLPSCLHHDRGAAILPPPIPREFRAAWVATVENIDWPSKPGLSTEAQQHEIIAILNTAQSLHLNAIILQVRTSCDALYPSVIEPWSYYLTGQQAMPPKPFYDPLKMWVEESHRRGIELHAWFNPFRAKPAHAKYPLASSHIANIHPDLVKKYGDVLWLDPGETAAQELSLRVMMDVVRRYDVDGIHIDDYFYPYPEHGSAGELLQFPDDASWSRYGQAGGKLSRDDWRRENINQLVHRMYTETKKLKPWVKVGISPFGIWKPGFPPVVKGFNQYESLYADAKLWLNNGWCDYFTPQLYWKTTAPNQPFEPLLKWWASQSSQGRPVWPGLFTSRVEKATTQPTASTVRASWTPQDIIDQIDVTRRTQASPGHVHFSMITLMQSRQHIDSRLGDLYAEPALVPPAPWLERSAPSPPHYSVDRRGDLFTVSWSKGSWFEHLPWIWIVQTQYASGWKTTIYPREVTGAILPFDPALGPPVAVSVTAVNRFGNQSPQQPASLPHLRP